MNTRKEIALFMKGKNRMPHPSPILVCLFKPPGITMFVSLNSLELQCCLFKPPGITMFVSLNSLALQCLSL